MTWAAGESPEETFETARGSTCCLQRPPTSRPDSPGISEGTVSRCRCGCSKRWLRECETKSGAASAERLMVDGFEPMGCDGSRVECPRSPELEPDLPTGGKDGLGSDPLGHRVRASFHRRALVVASGAGTADERHICADSWGHCRLPPLIVVDAPTWATHWLQRSWRPRCPF